MQDLYKKGGGGSILDFDLHASGGKTLGLLCQETYIVGQGGGADPLEPLGSAHGRCCYSVMFRSPGNVHYLAAAT